MLQKKIKICIHNLLKNQNERFNKKKTGTDLLIFFFFVITRLHFIFFLVTFFKKKGSETGIEMVSADKKKEMV